MRMPLLWLNVMLATFLGLLYTQPELFIAPDAIDFVVIAAGQTGSEAYGEARVAAENFERDLGRQVEVIGAHHTARDLAVALKQAIAREPQGISMPGHGDAELLLPFITEAQRRGIRVTFHSFPLPEAERRFRDRGTGYAGTRSTLDGKYAARSILRRFEDPTQVQALIVGTQATLREDSHLAGCKKYIEEQGGTAEILEVGLPEDLNDQTDPALDARIAGTPRPNLIFWDAGPVYQVTALLNGNDYDASDVSVATFVPAPTLPLVEQLYIKQQYFEQKRLAAYVSLVQLYLADRHAVPGMHIPINASL